MTGLEVALVGAAIKEGSAPARSLVSKIGKRGYDKLVASFTKTFGAHVAASRDRCSHIKNILYRDHSVPLLSQYVHVRFRETQLPRRGAREITDEQVISRVISHGRCLISGTAGAGKTMFMKWGTLELIDTISSHGRIPLFLELRYYSQEDSDLSLAQYLLKRTSSKRGRVSLAQFEVGLEAGQFVIILDAVDEVNPAHRDGIIRKIREFIDDYPECPIMISTRPDESLESVQQLSVIRSLPMTQEQIIEVLTKVDYDDSVKQRLISKLNEGLYKSQADFLSNPLLATIMLLSFDYAADIPTKLTSFYRQAFEALYQRHDAAKGTYRRGHHAGLPMDEFASVFSAFCYNSYVDSKYEFSDRELLKYIREAVEYAEVVKDAEMLVRDSTESVCLLQKEGLDNVFAHRSFQEYFAAVFVSEYRGPDVAEVIESLYSGTFESNVLQMLFELNRDLIESEWIEPRLQTWLDSTRELDLLNIQDLSRMMELSWPDVDVDANGDIEGFTLADDVFGTWISMVEQWHDSRPIGDALFDRTPIAAARPYSDLAADPKISALPSFQRTEDAIEFEDEDGEGTIMIIGVSPKDADWLVETSMPHRLQAARKAAEKFLSAIQSRHATRRSAVRRMRTSARTRSPTH